MLTIHRSTLALLALFFFAAGGAVSFYHFSDKLLRISAERTAYYELTTTAISTSHKSINFAEAYRRELDACIQKLVYAKQQEDKGLTHVASTRR